MHVRKQSLADEFEVTGRMEADEKRVKGKEKSIQCWNVLGKTKS